MKELLAKIIAPATESGNLSVGRTLLLLCFTLAMWKWAHGLDVVSTQQTVLLTLIGYVFGTKALPVVQNLFGK